MPTRIGGSFGGMPRFPPSYKGGSFGGMPRFPPFPPSVFKPKMPQGFQIPKMPKYKPPKMPKIPKIPSTPMGRLPPTLFQKIGMFFHENKWLGLVIGGLVIGGLAYVIFRKKGYKVKMHHSIPYPMLVKAKAYVPKKVAVKGKGYKVDIG